MKVNNKKENILLKILFLLMCIIIMGAVLIRLYITDIIEFPSTTSDELAYLSQAARYAGIDGRNLMKYYAFYGQGASIIWAILFPVFSNNPVQIYKAIVLLNTLMLILSFYISYRCSNLLFPKWNNWIRIFSCFLIVIYPCNLYYTQIASTESILYLLYWLMFYNFIKFIKTYKKIYIILYSFLASMMLWVHYRTIVIFGISILLLGVLFLIKRMDRMDFFVSMTILVGGYLFFHFLKEGHYGYIGVVDDITSANVNLPYTEIIQNVFLKMTDFIKGCFIQTYYFFVIGSIPFVFWILGEGRFFKGIIKKEENFDDINSIILSFLAMMYIGNILANATSQINLVNRYDKVVYARYIENLMGPILLVGLYYMTTFSLKLKVKVTLLLSCFIQILANLIYQKMLTSSNKIFAIDSSVGLGAFFDFYPSEIELFKGVFNSSILFLISLILITIIQIDKYKNRMRNTSVVCLLGLVGLFWTIIGNTSNKYHDNIRVYIKEEYYEIVNEIIKIEPRKIIYVRDEEAHPTCLEGKYVQWALVDKYVFDVVNSNEINNNIEREAIYITSSKTDMSDIIEEGFILHTSNDKIDLYIYNINKGSDKLCKQ